LCYRDLSRPEPELWYRACYVASELGTEKIVQRIRMQPDELYVVGATTLQEWWQSSTPHQRFRVLSHAKRTGKPFSGLFNPKGEFSGTYAKILDRLHCPFRDFDVSVFETETSDEEEWSIPEGEGTLIN